MVSGALPLLPVTKVGPGDKERAYVVRQNLVLKTLLVAFSLFGGLAVLLCCTVYEVHVQRRSSLLGAREHREAEHTSHVRVMRLSMMLQQRLKDEIHDMSVLTTYRAWLMRAVGDYQNDIAQELSNYTEVQSQLRKLGADFDQQLDRLLKRLWDDLVREGRQAQTQLHNITAAIMGELKQDASEAADFEQLMKAAGESTHMEGHHDHYHHERHNLEHGDHDEEYRDYEYGESEDESSLGGALEAFHKQLQSEDSVVHLDNATLAAWEAQYHSSMKILGDEDKEADMVRINRNIEKLLEGAKLPLYNASTHASEMDYFTDLLYRAKLAPYRGELLELLGQWQKHEVPFSTPLERVEELIDANVLQPDVLLVSPDEYEYPYDD